MKNYRLHLFTPMNIQKKTALLIAVSMLLHLNIFAQNVRVAIAANLQPVMKVLRADFKQRTGISVDVISGASGKLSAQITGGAPFDVFLSADMKFPDVLWQVGFATKEPVVYAYGALIIASNKKIDVTHWQKLLPGNAVRNIAIGDPSLAPYGSAAEEVLKKAGIYAAVEGKIVLGESIGQVNTYITTGVVQAGFTTLSLIKDPANKTPLYWHIIDPKAYTPITHGMVLLKRGAKNATAVKFYRYMLSAPAKKILTAYGYHQ